MIFQAKTWTKKVSNNRRAYTLLELLVVTVLTVCIVGLVAVRLGPVLNEAQMQATVDSLTTFDGQVRDRCARFHETSELVYDFAKRQVRVKQRRGAEQRWRSVKLPARVDLEKVILAGGKVRDHDQVYIPISRSGLTQSYAVCLSTVNRGTWFVIAGTTGQVIPVESESDAKELLAAALSSGNHVN